MCSTAFWSDGESQGSGAGCAEPEPRIACQIHYFTSFHDSDEHRLSGEITTPAAYPRCSRRRSPATADASSPKGSTTCRGWLPPVPSRPHWRRTSGRPAWRSCGSRRARAVAPPGDSMPTTPRHPDVLRRAAARRQPPSQSSSGERDPREHAAMRVTRGSRTCSADGLLSISARRAQEALIWRQPTPPR